MENELKHLRTELGRAYRALAAYTNANTWQAKSGVTPWKDDKPNGYAQAKYKSTRGPVEGGPQPGQGNAPVYTDEDIPF